jgi:hypothetical protein
MLSKEKNSNKFSDLKALFKGEKRKKGERRRETGFLYSYIPFSFLPSFILRFS